MDKAEIVIRIKEAIETIDKAHNIVFGLLRNIEPLGDNGLIPLAESIDCLYQTKFLLEKLLDYAYSVVGAEDND